VCMPKRHLKVDGVERGDLKYHAMEADRQQETRAGWDCIGAMAKDFESLVELIPVAYGPPE